MDRLISENKVLEAIDNLKANFTCYDFVTLDEVASHVKAIPSAYKGMTNGEVVKTVFPDIPRTLEWHIQNVADDDWWNSPYSEEGSD